MRLAYSLGSLLTINQILDCATHLSKNIIKDLPSKGNIENVTFPKYAKSGKLNIIKFKNVKWYSIDTYKDMEECSKEVSKIIK